MRRQAGDAGRLAKGARPYWGVESMHCLLDVAFNDDLLRYRTGNGAKNMAVVHRFSLNLVRAHEDKGSVKTKRETTGWSTAYLSQVLGLK